MNDNPDDVKSWLAKHNCKAIVSGGLDEIKYLLNQNNFNYEETDILLDFIVSTLELCYVANGRGIVLKDKKFILHIVFMEEYRYLLLPISNPESGKLGGL